MADRICTLQLQVSESPAPSCLWLQKTEITVGHRLIACGEARTEALQLGSCSRGDLHVVLRSRDPPPRPAAPFWALGMHQHVTFSFCAGNQLLAMTQDSHARVRAPGRCTCVWGLMGAYARHRPRAASYRLASIWVAFWAGHGSPSPQHRRCYVSFLRRALGAERAGWLFRSGWRPDCWGGRTGGATARRWVGFSCSFSFTCSIWSWLRAGSCSPCCACLFLPCLALLQHRLFLFYTASLVVDFAEYLPFGVLWILAFSFTLTHHALFIAFAFYLVY